MNAATLLVLASPLRDQSPAEVRIVAASFAALASASYGILLLLDLRGTSSRHSELATCYSSLGLSCQIVLDKLHEGRVSAEECEAVLDCTTALAKEMEIRSHDLDTSCAIPLVYDAGSPCNELNQS
jgi:hypothetical protein